MGPLEALELGLAWLCLSVERRVFPRAHWGLHFRVPVARTASPGRTPGEACVGNGAVR